MDNILTLYLDNDQKSPDYLTVNSCGICTNESDGDCLVKRPDGRQDFLLLLLLKGVMIVESEDESFTLYPGQLLLYRPHQPQFYRTPPGVSYETRWVHFSGTGCEPLLGQLNLPYCTPLMMRDTLEAERITADMVGEFLQKKPRYETILTGRFLTLLGLVSRHVYAADVIGKGIWETRVEETRKEIYYYHCDALDMEQFAQHCGLSFSRFLHLFKKQYGVSPRRYQIMLRMETAKTMLQSTDLSVREISERVGYTDQNYFSRIFKQHTGYAPTKYRK